MLGYLTLLLHLDFLKNIIKYTFFSLKDAIENSGVQYCKFWYRTDTYADTFNL